MSGDGGGKAVAKEDDCKKARVSSNPAAYSLYGINNLHSLSSARIFYFKTWDSVNGRLN
jgi:hypothetical protein